MRHHTPLIWAMLTVTLLSLSISQPNQAATTYRVNLPIVISTGSGPDLYWGAAVKGPPYDMSKLDAFEANVGKKVSIFHWTHSWVEQGAYRGFLKGEFNAIRAHGSLPMMTWTTDAQGQGISQPDFQLRAIYEGKHDAFIRQWATDAKSWGHPLFLRLNHEMNGWWYVWSEQANDNQPGDFVKAWRHIHDIFTQVGVTNVTWVWCLNATGYGRLTPAASLYPGDDYVDWVALDGYNFGADGVDGWLTAEQIFRPLYDELARIAPSKPVMIAEVASAENGGPIGRPGSKAAWIAASLAGMPAQFPKVRALLWFNQDGGAGKYEWPIESSTQAARAFAGEIASSRYAANLFGDAGPTTIAPLRP
ncbi:hypothetical protein K2Z83_01275 [Oscillochloris sp. ZM17-4]|uniref:glycoside hydrolase family 26 protein n=1 Tax=Oscillochloris sp. ZM17-4 TaxID=2866714 RepID=UPI001C72C29F|nr:glycosyl hydrolase [Oscillochloris sp. ZM17-4]MBX0326324.1 hypothetical protein [Oscillochloris sp. ZM17-4]